MAADKTANAIEQSGRTIDDAVQSALQRLGLSRAEVSVEVLQEGRTGILGIGNARALVRVTPREGSQPQAQSQSESRSGGRALPRIDDYADLSEIDRDRGRPSRQAVQPDHRGRSRPSAATPPQSGSGGGRGGRGNRGGRGRGREREREETRSQSGPREPIGPFELLADPDYEPNEDPRAFAVEVLTDLVRQLGFDADVTARDPETPMDGLGHSTSVLDVKAKPGDDLGLLIGRHGSHVIALQYVVNVIVSRALAGNHPITVDVDGYRRRREQAIEDMTKRAAEEVREFGEPVTLGAMPAAERRIVHLQLQEDSELTTESFGDGASRRVRILYRDQ